MLLDSLAQSFNNTEEREKGHVRMVNHLSRCRPSLLNEGASGLRSAVVEVIETVQERVHASVDAPD